VSDSQGALHGVRTRYSDMLDFIGRPAEGRHVKEVEGYMLNKFGLTPQASRKYLTWAEDYGQIQYTNPNRSRVKRL
jgi:hypothetical protein